MAGRAAIAFLVFLAVCVGVSYYLYDFSPAGIGFVGGKAIFSLSVPALIAVIIAKRKNRKIRFDIAFVWATILLLLGNRDEISSIL